jgi:hypothetical protein
MTDQSKEWWDGYYRGIKEASETWATAVYYEVADSLLAYDILEAANKELGIRSLDDSATARRVDDAVRGGKPHGHR